MTSGVRSFIFAVAVAFLFFSDFGVQGEGSADCIICGDFEKIESCGRPAGWTPLDYGWDIESAGNLFFVSRDAFAGNGAGAIVLNTFENGWSATPLTDLKPDTWYCLSARTKTMLKRLYGNGPTIFVFKHLPGKNRMGTNPDRFFGTYAMGSAPEDWALMKLAFKTPEETGHMFVGIGLYHALGGVLFDDLQIEEISAEEADVIRKEFVSYDNWDDLLKSSNLVVNSSFEIVTAPHMPDGWSNSMHYAGWKRDFYEAVRVVKDNPYHGEKCLKIRDGRLRYVGSHPIKKLDAPSVVSFYLRTDVPGSEFIIFNKKFNPGENWKRYSVTLPEGQSPDFWITSKGTIYLDAVQMETGTTPGDYKPNHRDALLATPLPQAHEAPVVDIGKPVCRGGRIEWKKGIVVPSFNTVSGGPARKATRAFIVNGEDALHVRFECFGGIYEKSVKEMLRHDESPIGGDAVAVSINPGFENGQDRPFVFEVNSSGMKRDAFGVNTAWDADWHAETGRLRNGYWAELTIPYAVLNHDFASDIWQINVIRYGMEKSGWQREISAWFNPGFVMPEFTGMRVAGFEGVNEYRVSVGNPEVVFCRVGRFYDEDLFDVNFRIGTNGAERRGKTLLSSPLGLNKETSWQTEGGTALLSFGPFTNEEIKDIKDFTLSVLIDDRTVAVRKFRQHLLPEPLLKVGPLDRNYYTNEKTAGLLVDVNVSSALAQRLQLDVSIIGKMKRFFHKRYPAESSVIKIPLPELTPGDYLIKTDLVEGNSGAYIFASGQAMLTKLVPSEIETKVNPITRMLVINGKEYFQHGLSVSAAANTAETFERRMEYLLLDIEAIAARFTGITPLYVTLDRDREKTVPGVKKLVEAFHRAGLDVTLGIPSISKSAAFDPGDRFFDDRFDALNQYEIKSWPVAGWYQFDEAYGWWEKNPENKESDLVDFYWKLKEFDPYRVFYTDTCHCGMIYGGLNHADWIGGSYYPISFYPPMNMVSGIRGFAMETEKTRKVVDARIVTGGYLPCFAYERGREPSPEEYRAAVYLMLINGCRAANLWMYSVFSQELWDGMLPLKEELSFLSRILSEGKNISTMISISNSSVDFSAWQYQGKTYVISASFSPEGVTAAFDLKLLGNISTAKEIYTKRGLKIDSKILSDRFEKFACRVYEIE